MKILLGYKAIGLSINDSCKLNFPVDGNIRENKFQVQWISNLFLQFWSLKAAADADGGKAWAGGQPSAEFLHKNVQNVWKRNWQIPGLQRLV